MKIRMNKNISFALVGSHHYHRQFGSCILTKGAVELDVQVTVTLICVDFHY